MPLQDYLQRNEDELTAAAKQQQWADRETARLKKQEVMDYVAAQFPKFWASHLHSPLITGATLAKRDPNVGLSGHNAVALIIDEKYLLYFYRNSAYYQMTLATYLGEFVRLDDRKTVSAPMGSPEENDRNLAQLFQRLEALS